MNFSDGTEDVYVKYDIRYNEKEKVLYYLIYASQINPNQELEKILESFKIQ